MTTPTVGTIMRKAYFLTLANKQTFHHIGSDQGLLPAPVAAQQVAISPGERMDFVLDFLDHAGEEIIRKDQTLSIMQIRVAKGKVTDQSSLPTTLRPVARLDPSTAVKTRRLTLEEIDYLTGEPEVHLLDGKRWHEPYLRKIGSELNRNMGVYESNG
jgi:spore coat protein A, manganese oxidase